MKKLIKVTAILSVILAIVGLGMMITGFSMEGGDFSAIIKGFEGVNKMEQITREINSEVTELEIGLINSEVNVVVGEEFKFETEIYSKLKIKESANGNNFSFKVETKWSFGSPTKVKSVLTVPKEYSGRLALEVISGKVTVSDATISNLYIKTVSAHINVENVIADKAIVKSTSGSIKLKGMTVSDWLETKSVSGRVEVAGSSAKGILAESTSGKIVIENSRSKEMDIKSVSGDVEASGGIAARTSMKTTSGDVSVELKEETDIETESTSGDVRVNGEKMGDGYSRYTDSENSLIIKTLSGEINIKE